MKHRPVYEREQDRANERAVADIIEPLWDCRIYRNPRYYPFDYSIVRGDRLEALAELKCRTTPMARYPTYYVSMHKWLEARRFSLDSGLPMIVVVRWSDCIGWVRASDEMPVWYGVNGRTDRDDWQDVEPVVHIPLDYFRIIA